MLDLINFGYCLIILLTISHILRIKKWIFIVLFFHLMCIFLFNDFLFPATYMPDQFRYLETSQAFRNFDFREFDSGSAAITSLYFAFFPMPFINSLYSISFINFLLYLFVFVFMYKKGFFASRFITYFYFLYPSLLLYSSVALRDIGVFFIMFFGVYYILMAKKNILGFSIFLFLLFIKLQNLLIFVVSFFASILVSKKMNIKYFSISLVFIIIVMSYYIEFFSLEKLNYFRERFYSENSLTIKEPFVPIISYLELIKEIIPSVLIFMFRPFPWQEFGILQFIQFIENCIIGLCIIYIMFQNLKYKLWGRFEVKFLNIFLLLALFIYGLNIYNSGTAVRYKFPFITIYIIYSWYFIYQAKQFYKKNFKWRE